jgi:hypothetical protein
LAKRSGRRSEQARAWRYDPVSQREPRQAAERVAAATDRPNLIRAMPVEGLHEPTGRTGRTETGGQHEQ